MGTNNFGAVRLFAAWLVVFGHGKDMVGLATPTLWGRPVAQIGLDLFFSVSGFLIYDSWLRDPRPGSFVAKRALRIFPGLAACVLVCILVIGTAETTLPLRRYFTHHATWQFLLNAALYLRLYLPGVFTQRLLGGAVNGSLWSLFPEFLCYLAVPLIWLAGPGLRRLALLAVMAACGAGGLYMFAFHPTGYSLIYSADPKYVLVQVPFFMAGAFWRDLQRRVPGLFRPDLALLLGAATFIAPEAMGPASVPLRWLTLSYSVLAFSMLSTPVLRSASRWGDLSYGAYLYAFPIQQLVLDHAVPYPITVATVLSLAAGFTSWHLVERPALRLKPVRGRRPDSALGTADPVAAGAVEREPDWAAWGRRLLRLAVGTPALPAAAALLLLAATASRFGFGYWRLPDYSFVGALRSGEWGPAGSMALAHPLAALLLLPYAAVVLWTGSAALVSFCLGLGALAAACTAVAAAGPATQHRIGVACLALAAFAFGVAVAGPADSPWAAAMLLPLAAAAAALPFLAAAPDHPGWAVLLLVVAAGSGPAGAGLALGMVAARAARPASRRPALLLPAALAFLVLAAVPAWGMRGLPLLAGGGWTLAAFAVGLAGCWEAVSATRLPGGAAVALLLGSAGGAGAALLAGEPAFAPVLGSLFLAVCVRWLLGRVPVLRRAVPVLPALLAVALVPALLRQLPRAADAATYHFAVEARARTWASARTPGAAMEFYLPPEDLGLLRRPTGVYTVSATGPEPLAAVARVFRKTVIAVCEPWQQHESWLIDGRFVPACPPHDGPADHVVLTR